MFKPITALFVLCLFVAACASADTEITKQRATQELLPYPERILVYNFAVSPNEVELDSAVGKRLLRAIEDTTEDTTEDQAKSEIAHAVAGIVAEKLAIEIRELGLPAERWSGTTPAIQNGYTIEGQFLTIDEGNRASRMIIGFGIGGTEVQTLVQAYHVKGSSKELLGEAKVSAESSKKPGIAGTLPVGAAVSGIKTAAVVSTGVGVVTEINQSVKDGAERTAEAIIELLKPRFVEQGWIRAD